LQYGQVSQRITNLHRLFFFRRALSHGSVIGDPSGRLYLHRGHRQMAHSHSIYPGGSQRNFVPQEGHTSDLFIFGSSFGHRVLIFLRD